MNLGFGWFALVVEPTSPPFSELTGGRQSNAAGFVTSLLDSCSGFLPSSTLLRVGSEVLLMMTDKGGSRKTSLPPPLPLGSRRGALLRSLKGAAGRLKPRVRSTSNHRSREKVCSLVDGPGLIP
jgi:hypothetical protein